MTHVCKEEIMVTRAAEGLSRSRVKTPSTLQGPECEIGYPELLEGNTAKEPMAFINAIRTGLPGDFVNRVSELLQVSKTEMYALLHITPRTAQRITRSERLDVDKSDHLVQLMKIHTRCLEVFEDSEKAARWLKTANFALGDQTPLSLLDTSEGIGLVADTLTRIEYGVFA
jgi:putative toxin-antitoxin system antitoxin component (TIGR02293 family)